MCIQIYLIFSQTCLVMSCVRAKFLHFCLTLCDPMDCSPRGSSVQGISRQEHWSGLLRPPPGALPNPGIEPVSLTSPALADRFFTISSIWKSLLLSYLFDICCFCYSKNISFSFPRERVTSQNYGVFSIFLFIISELFNRNVF